MAEQGVNTGSFRHRSGTADRARLQSLLRIALEQYPHKSPEDQAHEWRFMSRDLAAHEDGR